MRRSFLQILSYCIFNGTTIFSTYCFLTIVLAFRPCILTSPSSDSVTVLSHSFHTRSIIVSLEFIYQYLKATLEAFTPGQLFYKKKGQSSAPRKLIKRAIYSSVTANKRCHRHQVQSSFLMPSLKTRLSCFSTVTMRPFPSC